MRFTRRVRGSAVADAAVPTALGNTLHLIFPMGERFFVRAVKHFADQLEDPALRAQVKGFYAQEGRHAHEHERVFALLERHGYDVKPFLRIYKKIAFETIERVSPPKLRLAVTVALEHYTAIMAEDALEHGLLDRAHASMRPLLAWHAAEEIEHKGWPSMCSSRSTTATRCGWPGWRWRRRC